jgi:polysaccharide deacetylase 2 family uncharacterized protein YibQ
VAVDDLSAPLGQHKTQKRRLTVPAAVPRAVAATLSLCLIVFAAWALIADNPYGGEPLAVVSTDRRTAIAAKTSDEPAVPAPAQAVPQNPVPPIGTQTITIIDGTSGKRQDVVIPATPDGKSGADESPLLETSRHGAIPKIGPDGTRPADAYARPVKALAGKPNAPRVAIVIGGLGTSAARSNDAISKLPGAITLAFAPYGSDLDKMTARARSVGHEILLQVPMEPFDYPDSDPGPQTLLTSVDAAQNVDRLHWSMSRFRNYVGIANYMGARFSASEQALGPVLRETGKRGLIYLDDGASPRSLASQIAGANNLAFAKAEFVLDAVPTSADIDRALGRLEAAARSRGLAVGMASALPVSIERIARWAKAAESRGVLLVPISAAIIRANSS